MLREFRSPEFQKDYEFVLTRLALRDGVCALSDLRDTERRSALTVAYFFQSIAYLVVYRIIGQRDGYCNLPDVNSAFLEYS